MGVKVLTREFFVHVVEVGFGVGFLFVDCKIRKIEMRSSNRVNGVGQELINLKASKLCHSFHPLFFGAMLQKD